MVHSFLEPSINTKPESQKTINKKWFLGRTYVICIDGPSASGKGTLAKKLAQNLDFEYLDSGLLYRAIAYAALLYFTNLKKQIHLELPHTDSPNEKTTTEHLIDFENLPAHIPEFLKQILEYFSQENIYLKAAHIYHQNLDITSQLRNERIGLLASHLAKYPDVRQALLNKQREIASKNSLVADGRDMGSVVFPEADFKFFLTASLDERAWRRFCELYPDMNAHETAIKSPEYQKVFNSIQTRDYQDQSRDTAPLVAASDAILIDSEDLNSDEVFHKVLEEIKKKMEK